MIKIDAEGHLTVKRASISELIGRDVSGTPIVVMDHCYGCTAGQGSSCGGALEPAADAEAEADADHAPVREV